MILGLDSNIERAILQALGLLFARHRRSERNLQRIPLLDELISADRRERNVDVTDQIWFESVQRLLFASFDLAIDLTTKFRTT